MRLASKATEFERRGCRLVRGDFTFFSFCYLLFLRSRYPTFALQSYMIYRLFSSSS